VYAVVISTACAADNCRLESGTTSRLDLDRRGPRAQVALRAESIRHRQNLRDRRPFEWLSAPQAAAPKLGEGAAIESRDFIRRLPASAEIFELFRASRGGHLQTAIEYVA